MFDMQEALKFLDLPEIIDSNVKRIPVIYEQEFDIVDGELPTIEAVRSLAEAVTADAVVLDIEGWKIRGMPNKPEEVLENVTKYLQVLLWFKSARPDLSVGYFGFPKKNYVGATSNLDTDIYDTYQYEVDVVKPVFDDSDVTYPTAYMFEESLDHWKQALFGMVRETPFKTWITSEYTTLILFMSSLMLSSILY